jgi:hypothetical protein
VAEILDQLQGKRQRDWDHTAMIVLAVQRSAGIKNAQFTNPFVDNATAKSEFKKIFRKGT